MLLAVVRAPLSFFEQTPMGRIMNLFSRDQYVIDEVLIRVLGGFLRTMLVVSGELVICIVMLVLGLMDVSRHCCGCWRNVPVVPAYPHSSRIHLPRDYALLPRYVP
jgi:hypothetical protein